MVGQNSWKASLLNFFNKVFFSKKQKISYYKEGTSAKNFCHAYHHPVG